MSREHGGVVSRPDVDQLLVREAWLLDHQRLDEWLGLFTDDALYWAPLQMDQAEPFTTASLIYHDRRVPQSPPAPGAPTLRPPPGAPPPAPPPTRQRPGGAPNGGARDP